MFAQSVDVYVPGCAARPQSIIDGVVKSLAILKQKSEKLQAQGISVEKNREENENE